MHCTRCGIDAPTKLVSFHQNIGMFVTRQEREIKGELCRRCAREAFWSCTLTTLLLGWWGVISFVVTPFLVFGNIRAYLKCLSLPEPTFSAMNAPLPLHDVSRGGVTRGLILKVLYGTVVWGTVGVLALQNSPQFLERHSPRLSTYLERLGLVDKQVPSANVFGEHTLPDGTVEDERIEFPDGEKWFGVTKLPDGTHKAAREEFPDGERDFDAIRLPNGSYKKERVELASGQKWFEVTRFQDGREKVKRVEFPDGAEDFDVTKLPDGTRETERAEFPDGEKYFDVTKLPDGTQKVKRDELLDGEKHFDGTWLPDGRYKEVRAEFPDGTKWFEVTRLQNGTVKVKCVESPNGKKRFDVTIPAGSTEKAGRTAPPNTPASVTPISKQSGFAEWKASQR